MMPGLVNRPLGFSEQTNSSGQNYMSEQNYNTENWGVETRLTVNRHN